MNNIKPFELISIKCISSFIPEKSNIDIPIYFFSYKVVIKNNGKNNVRLLTRHWDIIDANGDLHTVNGEGVIGKKPIIEPGKRFEYTSFCPLKTEFGSMKGFYTFTDKDGNNLKTIIPEFGLIVPEIIN